MRAARGVLGQEPGNLQMAGLAAIPGVVHAFTTRTGGVSRPPYATLNLGLSVGDEPAAVQENRRRFFALLGVDASRVVRVRQVHGDAVLAVDEALERKPGFPRALLDEGYRYDALVTDRPALALVVSTADCVPILIADGRRRAIAAVHAGWRSTVRRIAERAVEALKGRYGTDPADCVAAIGPGIGGCCYEVDAPVVEPLSRALLTWKETLRPRGDGRWLLDLAEVNARILTEAGLRPEKIHRTGLCTACRPDLFFSHRGEGGRTGRMMNAIMFTP